MIQHGLASLLALIIRAGQIRLLMSCQCLHLRQIPGFANKPCSDALNVCKKYVHKKWAVGHVTESKCPFVGFLDFPANKFKREPENADKHAFASRRDRTGVLV